MAGMVPTRGADSTCNCPSSKDILEAAGLQMVATYIRFQHQTITSFIVNWLIFELCQRGEIRCGSTPHQFWREQNFNLEEASALAFADANVVSNDEEEE